MKINQIILSAELEKKQTKFDYNNYLNTFLSNSERRQFISRYYGSDFTFTVTRNLKFKVYLTKHLNFWLKLQGFKRLFKLIARDISHFISYDNNIKKIPFKNIQVLNIQASLSIEKFPFLKINPVFLNNFFKSELKDLNLHYTPKTNHISSHIDPDIVPNQINYKISFGKSNSVLVSKNKFCIVSNSVLNFQYLLSDLNKLSEKLFYVLLEEYTDNTALSTFPTTESLLEQ